jgi:uncharacterized membrane protein
MTAEFPAWTPPSPGDSEKSFGLLFSFIIHNASLFLTMTAWLILALSLAGLIISLYFTFAYYGRVKHSRWIPEVFCAREGSSCVTVVQTPYARVFGVPNSLPGIFYYLGILLWLHLPVEFVVRPPLSTLFIVFRSAVLVASAISVVLGFYLVYALRVKLRTDCPLCYTSHAINLAIFVLFIATAE